MQKRLEQTLAILKKASVPWSPTIATLAETSSNFDHSLSAKIKIECNYVSIKLVLKKYGYAAIGINNVSMNYISFYIYHCLVFTLFFISGIHHLTAHLMCRMKILILRQLFSRVV